MKSMSSVPIGSSILRMANRIHRTHVGPSPSCREGDSTSRVILSEGQPGDVLERGLRRGPNA